ncbi:MAG: electron transfer flavoprotein [Novosphingobium sp.]
MSELPVNETIVIGGGLAGGAAAALLARGKHPVRLLEREAGPHDKVCGEFLSIEAQHDLAALGLDLARLGAVPITRVRLVAHGREAEAPLPFRALGLSRRILDEALLDTAEQAGVIIERGVRVSALDPSAVHTSTGVRPAGRILLATGKHALRGAPRPHAKQRDSGYVGFKMHWRLGARAAARLHGLIELLPFAGGYAGLQLVAPGVANLCLIVRRERLAQVGGSWDGLLAELLRDPAWATRLDDAEPLFGRPLTIANLPYGYLVDGDETASPELFRLGDQAAMTASLTGDGMAAALASARLAAGCILAGEPAGIYQARLRKAVGPQLRRAMLLQRATALPLAMRLAMGVLRAWPGLLGTVAGATRLPAWREQAHA